MKNLPFDSKILLNTIKKAEGILSIFDQKKVIAKSKRKNSKAVFDPM